MISIQMETIDIIKNENEELKQKIIFLKMGKINIKKMADREYDNNKTYQDREKVAPADASDQIETNWDSVVESFDDMKLKEELLRGIYAHGFEKPSAIQQRGIMPVISGKDVIAQV